MIRELAYAAILATSLVSAQTSSDCNPLKSTSCSSDPALGTSISVDFTEGPSNWFENVTGTDQISYTSDGLVFTLTEDGQAPTIQLTKYIMFGKLEAKVKAAAGTGIVSSLVLLSDDLDEIDWEWVGSDTTQAQSNFFSKGDTTTYDRGAFHSVSTPASTFHTYTVVWTESEATWYIDGTAMRTLQSTNSEGYPQTPMRVKLGPWVAGSSDNAAGTIEWAGGLADFTQGPFEMVVESITVEDYSTGDSYSYSDQSGSYESIESSGGSINGRQDSADSDFDTDAPSSSSSSTASSTSGASSSSSSTSSSASASSSSQASSTASSSSSESTTSTSSQSSSSSVASTSSYTTITVSSSTQVSSWTSSTSTPSTTDSSSASSSESATATSHESESASASSTSSHETESASGSATSSHETSSETSTEATTATATGTSSTKSAASTTTTTAEQSPTSSSSTTSTTSSESSATTTAFSSAGMLTSNKAFACLAFVAGLAFTL